MLKQLNVRCELANMSHTVGFSPDHKPMVQVLLICIWVTGSEFLNDPIVFVL
jgi:hypothetical protein